MEMTATWVGTVPCSELLVEMIECCPRVWGGDLVNILFDEVSLGPSRWGRIILVLGDSGDLGHLILGEFFWLSPGSCRGK